MDGQREFFFLLERQNCRMNREASEEERTSKTEEHKDQRTRLAEGRGLKRYHRLSALYEKEFRYTYSSKFTDELEAISHHE